MPLKVKCPKCAKILAAPDERAGQQVKCPGCGQVLRLPSRPAAPAAAGGSSAPAARPPAPPVKSPAPPTRGARRPAAPAPRKPEPAEEGATESSEAATPDADAEERKQRRQADFARKKRKAGIQRLVGLLFALAGAGLAGWGGYLLSAHRPKAGTPFLAAGIVVFVIGVIVAFSARAPRLSRAERRAARGE